jgi:hypothetical protein
VWWEESDPEEDPPDDIERSRSYHTFFINPDGEDFTFETETDGVTEPEFMTDDFAEAGWGEEPTVSRISGSGRGSSRWEVLQLWFGRVRPWAPAGRHCSVSDSSNLL